MANAVNGLAIGDPVAARLVRLLESEGAGLLGHSGDHSLLEHLVETYATVLRWRQPAWLAHAALLHSVYGTDVYKQRLFPTSRRGQLAEIAGDRAERLAYLFCATPRALLLAGTHIWARDVPDALAAWAVASPDERPVAGDELDALVLLHLANLAEQSRARDGSPGRWLVPLREMAELLLASESIALPPFIAELATLSEEDEALTRRSYRAGVEERDDLRVKVDSLALAAAVCPVVGEPCAWLAHLSWCRSDPASARSWAETAAHRLTNLGTAWDKRLRFEEWLELVNRLTDRGPHVSAAVIDDPRALWDAVRGARGPSSRRATAPPAAGSGRARFHRYIESLADGDGTAKGRAYPELEGKPWHDPSQFPLALYLEAHHEAIRDEILALEPSGFHRESEGIGRSGEWDVAFLYERGRRRDEVCDACPVTVRGIEQLGGIRNPAGLIYASRMRAGTHIHPHRGPTNVRLRCHLGIEVPEAGCAIRVGDETRRWLEGKCLVFDDHFEHEAWNRSAQDRIVLIVDVWHPGLSAIEVRLLDGLYRYTHSYARRLGRYWAANARASLPSPKS